MITGATRPVMPAAAGIDHAFVELPDGRMHVASCGSGEPVLLLSGFAQTWWEWRTVMPALAAAGFLAIAPDLRGEGWSELPSEPITRTRRAHDVLALLDRLGHDRVGLVSHDIGAITAFQLALARPDRCSSQVMLSVPPPQLRPSLQVMPGLRHLWHQQLLSAPGIGRAMLRRGHLTHHLFSHFATRPLDPQVVALADALLRDPELSVAAERLCRRMVVPEVVRILGGAYRRARFAMPSLFVFGTADIGFPAHVTREAFADPGVYGADVRLALVEGAGHFVVDEAPDRTAALIVGHVAST